MTWIGFGISVTALLFFSRWDLALALFASALFLGLFTIPPIDLAGAAIQTFTDPSVILLALIVGIIPIIGGMLEKSGQMDNLAENLHLNSKLFLSFSPAILGMLPMPGGALLSAPLVDKGGPSSISAPLKAAINVWFRHVLILVYPLTPALIASAKISGLNVYAVIPYLSPIFLVTAGIGYTFFIRETENSNPGSQGFAPSRRNTSVLPTGIF